MSSKGAKKMLFELQGILFEEFPTLYKDGLPHGFECEDGWFDLIKKLSDRLEKMNRRIADESEKIVAFQVEENLGGLEFHLRDPNSSAQKVIKVSERLSLRTCEICGHSGKSRDLSGWIRTLCDKCSM